MTEDEEEYLVLVKAFSPGIDRRAPSDIVLVVDVSGSMGAEATAPGVESSGLTLLDIVKHAVKTVIYSLNEHDRLALVSYSNAATVVFDLTPMNAAGKDTAMHLLDTLVPSGMTNLWDGLQTGLKLLRSRNNTPSASTSTSAATSTTAAAAAADILSRARAQEPGQGTASSTTAGGMQRGNNSAVLLLTDGEPNMEPPRGHIPMLKRYCEANGGYYPGIISTFGFGYSLDSVLLRKVHNKKTICLIY
jgi:hypothetical protein